MITIKSPQEIESIRRACEILKEVFRVIAPEMKPGAVSLEIDRKIEEEIRCRGGRPAFKGFKGSNGVPFPGSSCISIDAEVVHGIPDDRVFQSGQIIGLDIGVELNGFYGDACRTFLIGDINPEVRRLVEVTRNALYRGIQKARAGNRLSDISHAVQVEAESHGYSVVEELSGHGIGRALHEEPQIPNFGPPGRGPSLKAGMVMAIEPMLNFGRKEVVTAKDGWTVLTVDGLPSAHWEETIAITHGDPLILT